MGQVRKKMVNGVTLKNGNKINMIPEKVFKPCNSVLTDLFEINHFQSIRHCFAAIIILAFMNFLIVDIVGTGSVVHAFRYLFIAFGNFQYVILAWSIMFMLTLAVHPVFSSWFYFRNNLKPNSIFIKILDYTYLSMFLLLLWMLLSKVPPYIKKYQLPIASASTLLAEQVRFIMKMHGFVRSNAEKVLAYKKHSDQKYPVPKFQSYFSFLFFPTLVYKDEYPRTSKINWSFVALNFVEFFTGLFFFHFLAVNYIIPTWQTFGLEPLSWKIIISKISRTVLPASCFMLMGNYLLLHAWMNAWAEMTRFADRLFYMDWWNTITFSAYYRKWNLLIRDYLHTYIFKDMIEYILPGNRVVATCTVFFISALVHEYIIAFMLGYFLPIMFIQFAVFGLIFNFIKVKDQAFIGNTFIWWALSIGIGIQFSLYAMEYFSRVNCPIHDETILSYFIPRFFTCNAIQKQFS